MIDLILPISFLTVTIILTFRIRKLQADLVETREHLLALAEVVHLDITGESKSER